MNHLVTSPPREGFIPEMTRSEVDALPIIPWNELVTEWSNNYWDGPLSGLCNHNGKRYYFDMYDYIETPKIEDDPNITGHEDQEQPPDSRLYILIELTDAQLADEDYWHGEFVHHVQGKAETREKFYNPYAKAILQPCMKEQVKYQTIW